VIEVVIVENKPIEVIAVESDIVEVIVIENKPIEIVVEEMP
jgi:hypothetical protein